MTAKDLHPIPAIAKKALKAKTAKGLTGAKRSAKQNAKKPKVARAPAPERLVTSIAKLSQSSVSERYIPPQAVYRANPLQRIEWVRNGLPSEYVQKTAELLHISPDRLNRQLNIPRSTHDRKKREKTPLSQSQSERLMGVMMLIGQVEEIMAEAGDESDDFDAGAWVSQWIEEPLPALGNRTAGELMDTAEGQQLIARLLAQSVAGAYV